MRKFCRFQISAIIKNLKRVVSQLTVKILTIVRILSYQSLNKANDGLTKINPYKDLVGNSQNRGVIYFESADRTAHYSL